MIFVYCLCVHIEKAARGFLVHSQSSKIETINVVIDHKMDEPRDVVFHFCLISGVDAILT